MIDIAKQLYLQYSEFTQSNQFLGAAVAATLLGMVTLVFRSLPVAIAKWVWSRTTIRLELSYDNVWENRVTFELMAVWLHKRSIPFFSRAFSLSSEDDDVPRIRSGPDNQNTPRSLVAGSGTHLLTFGRQLFWYTVSSDSLSGASSVTKKKLVLTTFGFSSTKLKALVEQATEVPPKDFLSVLSFNSGNWGRTKVLPRSLASICLNTGVKENILKKLDWFLANRETYRAFGTTYKMGWLFSGEPGTGKTSLVKALASYLKQDVYLFNLSAMSDATLEVAVAEVPSGSVLLFEDIDCASGFTSREEKSQLGNGVSLGAVLSVLDGIRSAEGHLIFMTTNYPDRIDSAILRKGRTDVHISIDALEDDAVQEMSVSLFGRSVNKVSRIKGCDLQAIAFEHRDNFTSFDAAFEPFRAERI